MLRGSALVAYRYLSVVFTLGVASARGCERKGCTVDLRTGLSRGTGRVAWKGMAGNKKSIKKALIPLPPTGFASLFCAKPDGGANHAPAQARCGVCELYPLCTECKVLQRSAMALHSGTGRRGNGQIDETPGLHGVQLRKLAKDEIFIFGTALTRCDSETAQPDRKNRCEARPIRLSGVFRHCTASSQIRWHSVPISLL
jgi:hypothetical protein